MNNFKLAHMELVYWIDSNGSGAWHLKEDYIKGAKQADLCCRSCGFVYYEDDTKLALTLSESPFSYNADIIIPKCSIKRRLKLRIE